MVYDNIPTNLLFYGIIIQSIPERGCNEVESVGIVTIIKKINTTFSKYSLL